MWPAAARCCRCKPAALRVSRIAIDTSSTTCGRADEGRCKGHRAAHLATALMNSSVLAAGAEALHGARGPHKGMHRAFRCHLQPATWAARSCWLPHRAGLRCAAQSCEQTDPHTLSGSFSSSSRLTLNARCKTEALRAARFPWQPLVAVVNSVPRSPSTILNVSVCLLS